MAKDTINNIRDYFQALATAHVDIDTFVYGRLKTLQNALAAPGEKQRILFMEYPVAILRDPDGSPDKRFSVGLSIISPSDPDNISAEDTLISENMAIMQDLAVRMRSDAHAEEEENFVFTLNEFGNIEVVNFFTLDNCVGVRAEPQIGDWINFAVDTDKWDDLP